MTRLAFLVDEHVPRVFTTSLRSSGFEATTARERYGERSNDRTILDDCRREEMVVVTNDRDFVRMGDEHAGIVMYTDRTLLLDAPLEAVEAITRINRYYTPAEIRNTVEWLDDWT
ncbi:DUF5615 family PIN-like protein [Halomarina pelagica]|uniref:DUF5615 family PIN-like protein n=1 Tax=Halomarina pelagica TaxID=2961599 RepID=UPI0020C37AC4|nr:DUF5615 family PIN-like protein [Halomarina sp. BND7]